MPCRTCTRADDLATCLFCGHAFCALHRGDSGGAVACTECLQAEFTRKSEAEARRKARAAEAAAPDPLAAKPATDTAPPAPLRPLPEPPGNAPLGWGVAAAAPTAIYLYVFLGWLTRAQELAGWVLPLGTALGAAFAFAGVWAIVKSRRP